MLQEINAFLTYPLLQFKDGEITTLSLLKAILLLGLGLWLIRFSRKKILNWLLGHTKISPALANSITTLTYYVLLILLILSTISTIGIDISQLNILIGALGVGVGFGLQTIANNFISGIILLGERAIKIGDLVELEDKTIGEVKKINIRSTVIRTYEGQEIIVPNSEFISKRVNTWTHSDDWRRVNIPFGVSYKEDPEKIAKIAEEVGKTSPLTAEDEDHPVRVRFESFGDNSLNFTLVVWTRAEKIRKAHSVIVSDYYFALFKKFKEHGVEIPFPQRDLHLRSVSPEVIEKFKQALKEES